VNANLILFNLLGGVSLLLYGMRLAGEGLQAAAGSRLRLWLGTLTDQRLIGVLVGAVVTAVIQSSSATTVMLVGLASAGFMSLQQTLGVILGADVGSTLTVQLIAFHALDYALLLIGLAVPMMFATRRKQVNYLGQVLLGFGLLFLGMKLIAETAGPLRGSPLFQELLISLVDAPLLVTILSVAFTAVIQSSSGTIGIALAFAGQGLVPLALAIPIIIGANIGTSGTALISSIGANVEARRVAVAHALFKIIGAIVIFPFLPWFARVVQLIGGDISRQIANAHTLFNVLIVVLLIPFTSPLARLIRRVLPDEPRAEAAGQPRYLGEQVLDSPALAISQATRETLRLADITQSMLHDSLTVLETDDEVLLEDVIRRDDQVDRLNAAIKRYLTRLAEQNLSPELSQQEMALLYVISDLEHIGDIISKSLMLLLRKKMEGKHLLSTEGQQEIRTLHAQVSENLDQAIAAFAGQNFEIAQGVLRRKILVNQMERELRQAHIERLHKGLRESIDTSAIHLDVLNDLKRINSHATNIAYVVMGEL
jgi:phosphate:Na+ symporter